MIIFEKVIVLINSSNLSLLIGTQQVVSEVKLEKIRAVDLLFIYKLFSSFLHRQFSSCFLCYEAVVFPDYENFAYVDSLQCFQQKNMCFQCVEKHIYCFQMVCTCFLQSLLTSEKRALLFNIAISVLTPKMKSFCTKVAKTRLSSIGIIFYSSIHLKPHAKFVAKEHELYRFEKLECCEITANQVH